MSAIERVSEALAERRLRLALAESCTGGLLGAAITDRAGASRFLDASLVTYSNAAKERLLGVQPATLAAQGAVSEQVAKEMAEGARRVTEADLALSITGIAGPDGGTPEKPVGTVWIGLATERVSSAELYRFEGDRRMIREQSVDAALALLDRFLEERP